MAPSEKNKKEERKFLSKYLFLYNFVQFLGWSYISYQLLTYYLTGQYNQIKLWSYIFPPVAFFQTLALLEILHVILGFVKTSLMVTALQILFRVSNTFGVFNLLPANADTIGIPMTLTAWCGAEVTRYLFHIFKELNFVPYFVAWIRYSAFIILIPLGVSGELLGQYVIQSLYANKWNIKIEALNITVGYRHFIIAMMISTAQGIWFMYRHMFQQRRKALGPTRINSKKFENIDTKRN